MRINSSEDPSGGPGALSAIPGIKMRGNLRMICLSLPKIQPQASNVAVDSGSGHRVMDARATLCRYATRQLWSLKLTHGLRSGTSTRSTTSRLTRLLRLLLLLSRSQGSGKRLCHSLCTRAWARQCLSSCHRSSVRQVVGVARTDVCGCGAARIVAGRATACDDHPHPEAGWREQAHWSLSNFGARMDA